MFKTTKSKVIFVVIFSVICIIVTSLLILYKNIDTEDKAEETEEGLTIAKNEKDVNGIDVNGTYNQNDLKLEEKKYLSDKVQVNYYQITGLKDKIVQEKINREIEQYALNFYREKIKDLAQVKNVYVDVWCAANFANTLSFSIYYSANNIEDEQQYYSGNMALNYNLIDGEKITIDKLFTSDAPIENILRQSAYYSFVSKNVEPNLSWDFVVKDYDYIEDKILEVILAYKKGEITEFYFSPKNIIILYNENQTINISMEDYAEYIAVYNRYLTDESLYERNDIGLKNLYTLSTRYKDAYYYMNYQKGRNYFIDINIMNYGEDKIEFEKNLIQQKINSIETEIAKVKTLADKNSDKFYILNYNIYVYTTEEWTTNQLLTHYIERGNAYEMTTHDFEENIEPIIIEYNRREPSGEVPDYVYYFSEILNEDPQEINEYYVPETGEKIVI